MANRFQNAGTSTGGNDIYQYHGALNTINTRHFSTNTLALYGITGKETGSIVARSAQGS